MYVCISNMVSTLNRQREREREAKKESEKRREEKNISTVMNVEP